VSEPGRSWVGIITPLSTPQNVHALADRDRLESWKEIAAFLKRSERTVRRWEEREGLPVHRLAHDKRGSVYAYAWELERWRESRRQLLEADVDVPAPTGMSGRWRWVIAGAAIILLASAAWYWLVGSKSTAQASAPNPEAVRLVQLASFGPNAGRKQIETGIGYYQDAIRLDPEYAPAWVGLATAHLVQVWFGETPALEASARAKTEAQRALAIDPKSGTAMRVLAGINHFIEWDHAAAERQIRRAMDLDPTDAAAFSWFADFLLDMRRFTEARAFYLKAQAISPRWLEPITFAGNVHLFTGHPDLAIVEYRRVLESEPNYGLANLFLGRAYLAMGQHQQALDQLRKSNELLGEVPMSEADLGYALGVTGHRAEAEAMLGRLLKRRGDSYYPAFPIAQIYLGLGQTETALDWLERATDDHHLGFYLPSVDSLFDSVRLHPRFRRVLQRIRLDEAGLG
jgi:tetratricopeptide (TPR) repeat protein